MEESSFKCPTNGVTYKSKQFSKTDFQSIAETIPALKAFYDSMSATENLSVHINGRTGEEAVMATSKAITAFWYLQEGMVDEAKELFKEISDGRRKA